MIDANIAQAIFAGLVIVWGIVQTILSWRLAETTNKLQHEVQRLNMDLDQRIQRLYRARDLLNQMGEASMKAMFVKPGVPVTLGVEMMVQVSSIPELAGIVRVIGDRQLMDCVSKIGAGSTKLREAGDDPTKYAAQIPGFVEALADAHQRVYELLAAATDSK